MVSARGGDFVETALGAGDAGLECVLARWAWRRVSCPGVGVVRGPSRRVYRRGPRRIAAGRGVAASQSEIIMTSAMRSIAWRRRGPVDGSNVLTVYGALCGDRADGVQDWDDRAVGGEGQRRALEGLRRHHRAGVWLPRGARRVPRERGHSNRGTRATTCVASTRQARAAIVPAGGSSRVATPVSLYGATIHIVRLPTIASSGTFASRASSSSPGRFDASYPRGRSEGSSPWASAGFAPSPSTSSSTSLRPRCGRSGRTRGPVTFTAVP